MAKVTPIYKEVKTIAVRMIDPSAIPAAKQIKFGETYR